MTLGAHTCHAKGCEKTVPPTMLMCKIHWMMVPARLKAEVWRYYVPGQEESKDPTDRYLVAAQAAIDAVAEKEGK